MKRRKKLPTPLLDALEKKQGQLCAALTGVAMSILMYGQILNGSAARIPSDHGGYWGVGGEEGVISILCILGVSVIYGIVTLVRIYFDFKSRI